VSFLLDVVVSTLHEIGDTLCEVLLTIRGLLVQLSEFSDSDVEVGSRVRPSSPLEKGMLVVLISDRWQRGEGEHLQQSLSGQFILLLRVLFKFRLLVL